MKFGFVILHYMAFDMTVECVEKILKLFSDNPIKIVIVDNASFNGSGTRLREKYQNNESVEVLINHKNLGFAQGNNIGYLYLKANYNCDFIVIMNNDVLIEQTDFLEKIQTVYEETKFAVLGPDIYSPKLKDSQSPTYRNDVKNLHGLSYDSVLDINNSLHRFNSRVSYYWLRHTLFGWLRKFFPYKSSCRQSDENIVESSKVDFSKNIEGVVLHGACYILSKNFMENRKLAFNPDTFLYFEEDILHYECKMQNLKLLYSPSLKVTHLEDVSTDSVYRASFKKNKFINKQLEKSTTVFLSLVKDDTRGEIV